MIFNGPKGEKAKKQKAHACCGLTGKNATGNLRPIMMEGTPSCGLTGRMHNWQTFRNLREYGLGSTPLQLTGKILNWHSGKDTKEKTQLE